MSYKTSSSLEKELKFNEKLELEKEAITIKKTKRNKRKKLQNESSNEKENSLKKWKP
jgi:methionine-rich copper-binding protein CopC